MISRKISKKTSNQKGFTLIELILYIAIISIFITGTILFAWDIIHASVKSDIHREVSQNLRLVSMRIAHEIRNASGINSSPSLPGSSISLGNIDSSKNPTVIDLSSGRIRIGQGSSGSCPSSSPCYLTSNNVTVTSLQFTDLSSAGDESKNINFVITLESNADRKEWQKTQTYTGSVEIRSDEQSPLPTLTPTAGPSPTPTNTPTPTPASGWTNPALESGLDISGNDDGLKIQVSGNYAYVVRTSGSPDFAIINISNPAIPSLAGSLSLNGNPYNLSISGSYTYVSTGRNNQELQIINISSPSSPSVLGTYDAPGKEDALGTYEIGANVYLTRMSGAEDEFLIIDASTPSSPSLTGSLNLNEQANEIIVIGSYAYIASGHDSQELQVVDISTPASPTLAGSLDLSGTGNAISITGFGSTILVGRDDGYLYIIDVSTPSSPSQTSSYNCSGSINDISFDSSNNFVFTATANSGAELQIVDISTLSSPTSVGSFNSTAALNGIAYDATKDRVFAVSTDDAQELLIIQPQ